MKVIIDIPDNAYELLKNKAELDNIAESIIANGKPYEERPQGEWIDTGHKEEYWAEEYQCSICGAKDHWHKFCPNCGAPMKEDPDEVADDKHL